MEKINLYIRVLQFTLQIVWRYVIEKHVDRFHINFVEYIFVIYFIIYQNISTFTFPWCIWRIPWYIWRTDLYYSLNSQSQTSNNLVFGLLDSCQQVLLGLAFSGIWRGFLSSKMSSRPVTRHLFKDVLKKTSCKQVLKKMSCKQVLKRTSCKQVLEKTSWEWGVFALKSFSRRLGKQEMFAAKPV